MYSSKLMSPTDCERCEYRSLTFAGATDENTRYDYRTRDGIAASATAGRVSVMILMSLLV